MAAKLVRPVVAIARAKSRLGRGWIRPKSVFRGTLVKSRPKTV